MAITPTDIEQLTFSEANPGPGYAPQEVDAFLNRLCEEVDAMLQKIADLKGRLTQTEQQLAQAQSDLANAKSIDSARSSQENSELTASARQISQVLIVAQQSADKIVAEAHETADKVRTEADQKAREVIRQALAEKQNELDEIDRLKHSREEFRSEYKNLLQHFLDDADAAFPKQVLSAAVSSGSVRTSSSLPSSDPALAPTSSNPDATIYAPVNPVAPIQNAVDVDDLD